MQPILYRPTFSDVQYCMNVAKFRDKINRDLGWETGKHPNYSVLNHFVGACGEYAVSKIFGIEWEGAKLDMLDYQEWRKTKPDLGIFEVKTINFKSGNLRLGDNDKDWATAILILAEESWQLGCYLLGNRKNPGLRPFWLLGHIPVKVGREVGKPQSFERNGIKHINHIVERKLLRPADELHKTINGFNKIRKERQTMHSNGVEFKLSR
jgi:hypothetical protein